MPATHLLLISLLTAGAALLTLLQLVVTVAPAAGVYAQSGGSGIAQPESGATLSGVVTVTGTAVDANYLRYELAFRSETGTDQGWIVFAEGDQPVTNGILARWDTTVGRNANAPVWPDGRYQLRLRVVRTDYNYDEYFVTGLEIANDNPATPTPTPTLTATTAADSAAPVGTLAFVPLTPIPSLTPFPTPTPLAVAEGAAEEAVPLLEVDGEGGVLEQLQDVDTTPIGRSFWQGACVTAYLFGAFFLYLLLRRAGRRLWRIAWQRVNDNLEE